MGKRGTKPQGKVKLEWSPEFAYAIGLLTTGGNLSPDGRYIVFTSKDKELIDNFQKSLQIDLHVGRKASGSHKPKKYYVVQIGDVRFYGFLLGIGLTPRKTKTIGVVAVPRRYFFDFLRGHFDGDGSSYSYWDPRWRSSFMFYTSFLSASKKHIDWLRSVIADRAGVSGHITKSVKGSVYQLKYAKKESLKLFPMMYYNTRVICLSRKRLKMEKAFAVKDKH